MDYLAQTFLEMYPQDEINSMVVKYLENIESKPISDLNQSEAIKYFTKLKEIGFIFRVKLDESAFKKKQ
jgi:hypothetical protein